MRRISVTGGVLPAVLLAVLAAETGASPLAAPPARTAAVALQKVEQRVLAATSGGAQTSVIVLLADQADLSAAYGIKDHDARGWYVFNTLRNHARTRQADLRRLLRGAGIVSRDFWVANAVAVDGDRAWVEWLSSRSEVAAIEANLPQKWVEDPSPSIGAQSLAMSAGVEWGVSSVRAPEVWALGYTGQGIVIGNQDTGVQWNHPALMARYRGWDGSSADHNFNWRDAIHSGGGVCGANTTVPCDDNGHGTHTTGSSVGDDGLGNQIGVAPGAQWIGCRNMDRGVGTPATYLECFEFFLAPTDVSGNNPDPTRRPHVMNNSWVCPPGEGCAATTLQAAVESAEAAGIFVEASAGNEGPSCASVKHPPAIYAAAFSTAAYDSTNSLAGFSSRGPVTVDGSNRMKPDIAAPGVDVRSSWPGNAYVFRSGTSMAGPHVVGVVALLWSARPHLVREIEATRAILRTSANPAITLNPAQVCGGVSSNTIPNNSFGVGRVDALAAVNASAPSSPGPTASPTPPAPSATPSRTPTPTWTPTRSPTPTIPPTLTPTHTPTHTLTPVPTATASVSPTPSVSPTGTATPAATSTATITPVAGNAISGQIRYYSSNTPVPGAVVRLDGPTAGNAVSDPQGQFAFTELATADWGMVPEKSGGVGPAVTVLDAVYIIQAVSGLRTLSEIQTLACDVSGNGSLSTFDVVLVVQHVTGLIDRFPVAAACGSDWLFVPGPVVVPNQTVSFAGIDGAGCTPAAIAYTPLSGEAGNQDFLAAAFGDCTGNWQP